MSYIGFVFFLLMPSAPPWLANEWGVIQGLERPTGQAFRAVTPNRVDNFNTFQIWTKASPNPVAAFPSLHAAFPWLVLLFGVKFLGRGAWVFILYNASVWFSILYLGLHWAIDIFAGIALATAVFFGINWIWPRLAALPELALPVDITNPANRAFGVVSERWVRHLVMGQGALLGERTGRSRGPHRRSDLGFCRPCSIAARWSVSIRQRSSIPSTDCWASSCARESCPSGMFISSPAAHCSRTRNLVGCTSR